MHLTGGCFCGEVRYQIDAPLTGRKKLPLFALSKGLQWLGLRLCRDLTGIVLLDGGRKQPDLLRVRSRLGPGLLPPLRHHALRDA